MFGKKKKLGEEAQRPTNKQRLFFSSPFFGTFFNFAKSNLFQVGTSILEGLQYAKFLKLLRN